MKAVDENRVGRFLIGGIMLKQAPKAVAQVLSGGIVVRAECLGYRDAIEYVMYHEAFERVDFGSQAPLYECTVKDLIGGKHHVEWRKVQAQ